MSDKELAAWHANQDRTDTIWFAFASGCAMTGFAILIARMMLAL